MAPERIEVTGGGWLPIVDERATIGMDIAFSGGNTRPTGTLTYVDHVLKWTLQSTEILGLEVAGDEAWIRFAAIGDSGTNHTVYVHVGGGGAGVGRFDIRVSRDWAPCTGAGWIYTQRLTLGGGRIKVH